MQLHCPNSAAACHSARARRPALLPLCGRGALPQLLQQQCSNRRGGSCSSSAADGGDVVRPSAQAAAPLSPPVLSDLTTTSSSTTGSSSGAGSTTSNNNSSSNSTTGSSVGRSSSYSEFYKALNSTHYAAGNQHAQHAAGRPDSPAPPGSGNGTASAAAAAAAVDDVTASGPLQPVVASDGSGSGSSLAEPPPQQQHAAAAAAAADSAGTAPASAADAAGVEDALRKAQEALAAAESSLGSIHKLRSAHPPSKWVKLLALLRSTATAAAVGAFLVASHAFGLGWQWAGATIGALALAALAFKQQTITEAGAVAAAAAALATLGCSLRFGLVLLAVSYSSFKLRQFKEARAAPDVSSTAGAAALQQRQQWRQWQQQQPQQQQVVRDWLEIACIAAVPTILAVVYGAMAGCLDLPLGTLPNVETWRADLLTLLQGAVLGWYACVCGDAWSSELGELSSDQPRLLTTLKPVRRGTHGAVTLLGLTGAAAGGLLVGLVFYCAAVLSPTLWVFEAQRAAAMAQWRVIPLGLMAGLFGSLLDSLLGATLQFTGYDTATSSLTSRPGPSVRRISGLRLPWLTDNVVNMLAASVTAALTALAALAAFG